MAGSNLVTLSGVKAVTFFPREYVWSDQAYKGVDSAQGQEP